MRKKKQKDANKADIFQRSGDSKRGEIPLFFIVKVPDSSHMSEHACMCRHMDIGRAKVYE